MFLKKEGQAEQNPVLLGTLRHWGVWFFSGNLLFLTTLYAYSTAATDFGCSSEHFVLLQSRVPYLSPSAEETQEVGMSSSAVQFTKGTLDNYITDAIWAKQEGSFSMCKLDCICSDSRYLQCIMFYRSERLHTMCMNHKAWCPPKRFMCCMTNSQILSSYCPSLLNIYLLAPFLLLLSIFRSPCLLCFLCYWVVDTTTGEGPCPNAENY